MKQSIFSKPNRKYWALPLVVAGLAFLANCSFQNLAKFTFSMPEPQLVEMQIELLKRLGIGLNGEYPIQDYGVITLEAETPEHGFRFGFRLYTRVFLKETWKDFKEVDRLPTGARFPTWMTESVADVVIPQFNNPYADLHFYFGTTTQFYVGIAAQIHALNGDLPDLTIGYDFRDEQGRLIVGVLFFGPAPGKNGGDSIPGGIFVGTNVSPYLPKGFSPQMELATQWVEQANAGQPIFIQGHSVKAKVSLSGKDLKKYRNPADVQKVVSQYLEASWNTR